MQRGDEKCFGAVWAPGSQAIILGSYPSPKSFEQGFYYGHPQNRFWPLLARLCGRATPTTIAEKRRLILDSHLALWDTLESCEITGAADTSIKNPVPNDIAGLLRASGIKNIFCNGAASHKFYTKYALPNTGLPAVKLPSTSPANAAFTMERLYSEWSVLLPYIQG